MKKSFLKRAMAAAVAVPLALSQTILCGSFAADDAAGDNKALTVDTLLNVPVQADAEHVLAAEDDSVASNYGYKYATVTNEWGNKLADAVSTLIGTKDYAISTKALADALPQGGNAYVRVLKNVLENGTNAAVTVTDKAVIINADASYDVSVNVGEYADRVTLDKQTVAMSAVATIDTVQLENNTVSVNVELFTADGKKLATVNEIEAYAKSVLDGVRDAVAVEIAGIVAENQAALDDAKAKLAEAEAQGADTTEAQAEVDEAQANLDAAKAVANEKLDASYNNYLNRLNKAIDFINNQIDKDVIAVVSAGNYNEALTAIKNSYPNAVATFERITGYAYPQTVADALNSEAAVKALTAVVNQLNALAAEKGSTYYVDVTNADLVAVADNASAVTVDINKNAMIAGTTALLTDSLTDAEKDAYIEYFNVLEEENGKEVDPATFVSVKYVSVAAMGAGAFSAEGSMSVQRFIDYAVKDKETETDTETETETETDTDTTEPDTEPDTDPDTEPDTDPDTEPDTDPDTEPDTDPDTEPDTDPDTEPDTDPDTEPDTDPDTEPDTDPDPITVVTNITAVENEDNFYMAHDDAVFAAEDLLKSAACVITDENGETVVDMDVMDNIYFGMPGKGVDKELTPQAVYEAVGSSYAAIELDVYYDVEDDEEEALLVPDTTVKVYIGVKGDADLNGEANAVDASYVLQFSAEAGNGGTPDLLENNADPILEKFAFFLAEATTENKEHTNEILDAVDASFILNYAAIRGNNADLTDKDIWKQILPALFA